MKGCVAAKMEKPQGWGARDREDIGSFFGLKVEEKRGEMQDRDRGERISFAVSSRLIKGKKTTRAE